jgi:hypothetical protein
MEIELVITLTYSAATIFMMVLVWGISFVTVMRRIRLNTEQSVETSNTEAIRKKLYMVASPFDELRARKANQGNTARDNVTASERIAGVPVQPLVIQQTFVRSASSTDIDNSIHVQAS